MINLIQNYKKQIIYLMKKKQSFNKVINAYNAKIREYKSKIQLLKKKTKELTDEKFQLKKKLKKNK